MEMTSGAQAICFLKRLVIPMWASQSTPAKGMQFTGFWISDKDQSSSSLMNVKAGSSQLHFLQTS
jgi:hypothetical protein